MKKCIKKLVYSSFIAFISIGVNFTAEARVTREVAEATLPYLMEAAGIPQEQQTQAQKDAIISMIYTDAGQREMVRWAKDGIFPQNLIDAGFVTNNLYLYGWLSIPLLAFNPQQHDINTLMQNLFANLQHAPMLSYAIQEVRNAYIGALFPCSPGTFSSYAAHPSRLGYHILNGNLVDIGSALISGNALQNQGLAEAQGIINRLRQHQSIDNQLAYILFILDICDTDEQIKNILDQVLHPSLVRNTDIDASIRGAGIHNEYGHRPVSATTFPRTRQGDCVETLYRHLVNIAVQNDITAPKNFNVGHLPALPLRGYYDTLYREHIRDGVVTVPGTYTEAGRTKLDNHDSWRYALASSLFVSIANGTVLGSSFANIPQGHINAATNCVANQNQIAIAIAKGPLIKNSIISIIDGSQANVTADKIIALTKSVTTIISNATITDIVEVLKGVTPANMGQSNLGTYAAGGIEYRNARLIPTIQTSRGIPHDNGTNQQANATAIQNALNALDGRCNNGNERFIVSVTDDLDVIRVQANLPNGINIIIEIADKLWNRTIKVGIWTNKHAEIVSIN